MLKISNLSVSYGQVSVLSNVSLNVPAGQLVCLIGSNGAGKTTMLRTISGFVVPTGGEIELQGRSIVGERPHRITRLGVAQVPEGRHVFPDQTVKDNLLLGAFTRRGRAHRADLEIDYESIFELFPRLKERRKQIAGTLSGGEQQMLAIGRALMLRPKLLLLDEPSMGLAPLLIDEVFHRLLVLKERGVTMLLVEQLAYRAFEIADYGYVIEHGRIQVEGVAVQLQADPRVRAAYLGDSA